MNERIKQLDLEAAYGIIDPNRESTPEEMERFKAKFAELIVQECITVLDEDDGATHHTELLKEHFGVKNERN